MKLRLFSSDEPAVDGKPLERSVYDWLGKLVRELERMGGAVADIEDVGEYREASGLSVGSWSTGVAKNVASLALGAGDWLAVGTMRWYAAGAMTASGLSHGLSLTDGVLPGSALDRFESPTVGTSNWAVVGSTRPIRFTLKTPTTVYLVGSETFSAGSPLADGKITAWRPR